MLIAVWTDDGRAPDKHGHPRLCLSIEDEDGREVARACATECNYDTTSDGCGIIVDVDDPVYAVLAEMDWEGEWPEVPRLSAAGVPLDPLSGRDELRIPIV